MVSILVNGAWAYLWKLHETPTWATVKISPRVRHQCSQMESPRAADTKHSSRPAWPKVPYTKWELVNSGMYYEGHIGFFRVWLSGCLHTRAPVGSLEYFLV